MNAPSNIRWKVNEYQEQSYLLDPFLEQLVIPAVEKLKAHAKALVANPSTPVSVARLDRVAQILYTYIKFRGYKTISRYSQILVLLTCSSSIYQSDSFLMKSQIYQSYWIISLCPPARSTSRRNGLSAILCSSGYLLSV